MQLYMRKNLGPEYAYRPWLKRNYSHSAVFPDLERSEIHRAKRSRSLPPTLINEVLPEPLNTVYSPDYMVHKKHGKTITFGYVSP